MQLREAKHLLDAWMAQVDEETRESVLTNLPVDGEIMAAWKEHGDAGAAE